MPRSLETPPAAPSVATSLFHPFYFWSLEVNRVAALPVFRNRDGIGHDVSGVSGDSRILRHVLSVHTRRVLHAHTDNDQLFSFSPNQNTFWFLSRRVSVTYLVANRLQVDTQTQYDGTQLDVRSHRVGTCLESFDRGSRRRAPHVCDTSVEGERSCNTTLEHEVWIPQHVLRNHRRRSMTLFSFSLSVPISYFSALPPSFCLSQTYTPR